MSNQILGKEEGFQKKSLINEVKKNRRISISLFFLMAAKDRERKKALDTGHLREEEHQAIYEVIMPQISNWNLITVTDLTSNS